MKKIESNILVFIVNVYFAAKVSGGAGLHECEQTSSFVKSKTQSFSFAALG